MASDQVAQQGQLSVKKMSHAGQDNYGQVLRARPLQSGGQGHGVILLAMQHQGIGMQRLRNIGHLKAPRRRADQHDAAYGAQWMQSLYRV